jgi:DNA-binding NtrC family response regulator
MELNRIAGGDVKSCVVGKVGVGRIDLETQETNIAAAATGGLKGLARSAKDEAEAEAIAKALDETNWNRKQAATLLQISYKALLYKIRQYGIAQQNKSTHKLSAGAH